LQVSPIFGKQNNTKRTTKKIIAYLQGLPDFCQENKNFRYSLLDLPYLLGSILSLDAMGRQHAILAKILDKEADYFLALKGYQGILFN
jgi:hypothetical protein